MDYLTIINTIEDHWDVFLTLLFGLFAWYIYCHEVKEKRILELSKQVIAYYSEEQEAVKEIEEALKKENVKTIKTRLRNKAQSNENNLEKVYPSMTAKRARSYLFMPKTSRFLSRIRKCISREFHKLTSKIKNQER